MREANVGSETFRKITVLFQNVFTCKHVVSFSTGFTFTGVQIATSEHGHILFFRGGKISKFSAAIMLKAYSVRVYYLLLFSCWII
jgi:hypothetical protein